MNWKALAKSLGIVIGIPGGLWLGSMAPGLILQAIWIVAATMVAVGLTWMLYDLFDEEDK